MSHGIAGRRQHGSEVASSSSNCGPSEEPGWEGEPLAPSALRSAASSQPWAAHDAHSAVLNAQRAYPLGLPVEVLSGDHGEAIKQGVVSGHGYVYPNATDAGKGEAVPIVMVDLGLEGGFYDQAREMFVRVVPVAPELLRKKAV